MNKILDGITFAVGFLALILFVLFLIMRSLPQVADFLLSLGVL